MSGNQSGDRTNSTVFITTRPSDHYNGQSQAISSLRNVRIKHRGSQLVYQLDRTSHKGSEIIGPSKQGLKGFLQTYFKGKKKGDRIFDKFKKKKINNPILPDLRVKSQENVVRRHSKRSKLVYS